MMVEWLGEGAIARDIENAVAQMIARGTARTYDMGGHTSTIDMARAVAAALPCSHPATEDQVNMRATPPPRQGRKWCR
jgi:hypothetical protein